MAKKKSAVKKAKPGTVNVIRRAMKACQKKGIEIASETWGVRFDDEKQYFVNAPENKVCALGALLVNKNGSLKFKPTQGHREWRKEEQDDMAAYVLGVDKEWVESFIHGFDKDGETTVSAKSDHTYVRVKAGKFFVTIESQDTAVPDKERKLDPKKDLDAHNRELLSAFKMGRKLAEEFKV
jgi:hypothetical protein